LLGIKGYEVFQVDTVETLRSDLPPVKGRG
jgi:hypothetical protein